MCEEGLGDVGEEVGAVDGGDVYGVPAGIIFFGGNDYGRRNGDVADAAADVRAAALFLDGGIAVDEAVEFGFECALAVGIFFGREIVGKLEDKGVEDVVVLGNEGTGGLDVEAVAAEDAAEACEEAVAVGHEHHDFEGCCFGEGCGCGRLDFRCRRRGLRCARGFPAFDGGRSMRCRGCGGVFVGF